MLNQTLFKEVTFPLGTLIGEIESGGYPLLWDSADARSTRVVAIGTGRKEMPPSLLVIDG
jgi:hypothetical protein